MNDYITPRMRKHHEDWQERKTELNLRVINGDGDGTDLNWLVAMAENTAFVAKPKKRDMGPRYLMAQFVVARKFSNKCIMLGKDNGQMGNVYMFVDPFFFSCDWDLVEVLYDPLTMGPILTGEVTEDEQSSGISPGPERTDSDLGSNAGTENRDQGSEGDPSV